MSAPSPLSAEMIRKVRALRKIQKVSAQKLTDAMAETGFPITRTVLANMEGGRVATVSVDFLAAAAKVLGTDIVTLLTQPVACPQCKGEPPAGFTCNTCGGVR
jgi:transcriptional regulator with XRE-family HTH domain